MKGKKNILDLLASRLDVLKYKKKCRQGAFFLLMERTQDFFLPKIEIGDCSLSVHSLVTKIKCFYFFEKKIIEIKV